MSEALLLAAFVAAGFVVGVAIGRWWVAGAVAGLWLALDVVVLVRREASNATDPSSAVLVVLMAGVTAGAVVVTIVGIVVRRAVRASKMSKPR